MEEKTIFESGGYKILERGGLYHVAFFSGSYRHDWPKKYKRLGNAKRYFYSILAEAHGGWVTPPSVSD